MSFIKLNFQDDKYNPESGLMEGQVCRGLIVDTADILKVVESEAEPPNEYHSFIEFRSIGGFIAPITVKETVGEIFNMIKTVVIIPSPSAEDRA